MKRQKKDETEENTCHEFCMSGASWPACSQSAKSDCLGDASLLEGRLAFELWVRLNDNSATDYEQLSGLVARINSSISIMVYLSYISFWVFVHVDSVWSAAHSQSSTLQYPFLVQPESSGTPQSCTTAEPCPAFSGNTQTHTLRHIWYCCICEKLSESMLS